MYCLKSIKLGFNSTWTKNFQMYKLDLGKAQEPEIKLPTSIGSEKKQENSRKTSDSLTMLKPLTVWFTTTMKSSWRDENTRPPYLPAEKLYAGKKQQLELDMEQLTGSKLGNEYVKAVYCHPAYLTSMQSILCESWVGIIPSWNQDWLPGERSTTSDMQMIPL